MEWRAQRNVRSIKALLSRAWVAAYEGFDRFGQIGSHRVTSSQAELHVDVVTGRVGVGTDFVRLRHQILRVRVR